MRHARKHRDQPPDAEKAVYESVRLAFLLLLCHDVQEGRWHAFLNGELRVVRWQ